jgi:hypothetical protein
MQVQAWNSCPPGFWWLALSMKALKETNKTGGNIFSFYDGQSLPLWVLSKLAR